MFDCRYLIGSVGVGVGVELLVGVTVGVEVLVGVGVGVDVIAAVGVGVKFRPCGGNTLSATVLISVLK
jgi:hypothetical protein